MTSPGGPEQFLEMPAGRLAVPREPENVFAVRQTDWDRLRRDVEALGKGPRKLSGLGWSCVGLAGGAATALFPWLAAESQLPENARLDYAYITPALIGTLVFAAVLALAAFVLDHYVKGVRSSNATDVCADMDAMVAPHLAALEASNEPPPAQGAPPGDFPRIL